MAKTNLYDKNSIESLPPREFVRLRPWVYAGDTTYSTQLLIEALANAVDEYKLGHCDLINIDIDKDVITFSDNGQGFLVGEMREDGKSVIEAAFSVLNTSGKFREDGVYEGNSLGSYGIGGKLICFLSKSLVVSTYRDNKSEQIIFQDGFFVSRDVKDIEKNKTGTTIIWQPDPQFFTHTEVEIEKVREQLETTVCLCSGLTITLNYNGENKTYKSKNGLNDLVDAAVGDKEIIKNRFEMSFNEGKTRLNLAMTYTSAYSSTIVPYVNVGLTDSGPHITQIKTLITREFNQFIKKKGWLKEKEENLSGDDIQEGMYLVFNLTAVGVGYDAQVKSRVTKIDTSVQYRAFIERLREWLANNEKDAKVIAEKAINARKARTAAKKAREAVRTTASKKSKKKFLDLPTKLIDCWSKDRSECELIIVEGDSAANGLIEARDSEFQALFPIRGKMLNPMKTTSEKILANQEIVNIIKALDLELDIKTCKLKYDPKKLRYGYILIASDADPDGTFCAC